jgi:hypothetical protein
MPEKATIERAKRDKREGKAPSAQAGEFVKEEIDHIREGKHDAKSTKQAIAIGLSKARRAGVELPPPEKGEVPEATRRKAKRDLDAGKHKDDEPSPTRAKATKKALNKAGHSAASKSALSKQAKTAARKRSASDRSAAARKAARTKGKRGRSEAAKKAARTRRLRRSGRRDLVV